jgi:hypothetical protein
MVNTIVHEFVHNVDMFDDGRPGIGMGHGSNSSVGKQDSAPYWIGGLAGRYHRAAQNLPVEVVEDEPYEHEETGADEGTVIEEPETPLKDYDLEEQPEDGED